MRWLLVRRTRRLSWKADVQELSMSLADESPSADLLVELDDTLDGLAAIDPQLRAVVELRVFEGLSIEECCERLGCSVSTVTRNWRFAKLWLQNRLASPGGPALADELVEEE